MSPTRTRRAQDAGVVGASVAAAALMTWSAGRHWIDGVFTGVVLSMISVLVLGVSREWWRARTIGSRARALDRLEPDQVAREAVRAERDRLTGEITAGLRVTLVAVRQEAEAGSTATDVTGPATRIHDQARVATAELRRQLGLLRAVDEPLADPTAPPGPLSAPGPSRGDLLLGAAAGSLAVVETLLWPALDGRSVSVWSALLGGLAGATVVGRRTRPATAAVVCAGTFLLGVAVAVPVYPGFWFLLTVCGLLWTLAARVRAVSAAGAGAALVAAVLLEVGLTEPQNIPLDGVLMALALASGLLVRLARWRARASRRRAQQRDDELSAATRGAVDAERAAIARELHDTVSHAVGLVAMQSAAAMVSAHKDPAAARANLDLVRRTADAALADLDQAAVGTVRPRAPADLVALVGRIRAAGTVVDLQLDPGLGPELPDPVYRVVQEALTNVVRHAPGAAASVRVTCGAGGVLVEVTDDGPGVDAGAGRGFGLVGLDERVRFAGGSLETSSGTDGRGFRVLATLPSTQGVPA
jgi:signal transduction histidine kinase